MPITHLTSADFRIMPWANGLGRTVELLRREAADGSLLLRLSVADVVAEGPFSVLPGIDRVLTLIEGEGFDLDFGGDAPVTPARPFVPVAFSGDWPTAATHLKGPSRDFNVMTKRGAFDVAVTHLAAGHHAIAPALPGLAALYVVSGTAILADRGLMAGAGDLLLIDEAADIAVDIVGDALAIRMIARD